MWARARFAAAPSRAVSCSDTTPEMPSRSMAMNSFTGSSRASSGTVGAGHGAGADAARQRRDQARRPSRSSTRATSKGECM